MFTYQKLIDTVNKKSCAILGLGVSNLPLARLLLSFGVIESLTVYDKKTPEQLGEDALSLRESGVRFVCGEYCFDEIREDVVFRSPGIRPDIKGIAEARKRGAVLTSEIEQFVGIAPAKKFAITGSDGKTTSTTLTGKFLSVGGRAFVGGNIGTPLLDKCAEMTESDFAVLELSSFQLMTFTGSADAVAITNLSPNHLDWHTDLDEYARAKYNIVGKDTERAVLNAENETTRAFGEKLLSERNTEVIFFSSRAKNYFDIFSEALPKAKAVFERGGVIYMSDGKTETELLDTSLIRLPGRHNLENYMTAMALTYGYVPTEAYAEVAREFTGVEHRLELVRTLDGVDFYNGSIDSSPTRTVAALSALHGRDIVIICGGYDKNLDYSPLASALCESARAVVLTGATAPKIKAALLAHDGFDPERLALVETDSFEDAVARAATLGREGGCVLLSPASASFDRFKNFAERGRYFKELVRKL